MTSAADYLEELDELLLERGDDCMLLSQLDGFLTGVLVSPDLVPPSRWLKLVWAREDGAGVAAFDNAASLQHFIDLVMRHYHGVLSALGRPGSYEPVFEIDPNSDETLWEMWVEGFGQAMDLAPTGWQRILEDDNPGCRAAIEGIRMLHAIATGEATISREDEDRWDQEAPDLIPIWVEMLHQWRLANDPNRPGIIQRRKVGRNDPCPCGSGRKYKKCCGLN